MSYQLGWTFRWERTSELMEFRCPGAQSDGLIDEGSRRLQRPGESTVVKQGGWGCLEGSFVRFLSMTGLGRPIDRLKIGGGSRLSQKLLT